MKSGNLKLLEPSGPLQACNRTALPFNKTYAVIWNILRYVSVCPYLYSIERPLYLSSATRSAAQLWPACLQRHCPYNGSCWWRPLETVKMSRGALMCVHYSTHDIFIFTSLFLRDLFLHTCKKCVVLGKYISELTADAFFVNMASGYGFCGWRGYERTIAVTCGPAPTLEV
jgi:hypothetical protein